MVAMSFFVLFWLIWVLSLCLLLVDFDGQRFGGHCLCWWGCRRIVLISVLVFLDGGERVLSAGFCCYFFQVSLVVLGL